MEETVPTINISMDEYRRMRDMELKYKEMELKYKRENFFSHVVQAGSYECILNYARECNFPVADISSYLTESNVRTSALYGSSAKAPVAPDVDLTMCAFRRENLMGTSSEALVKTFTLEEEHLLPVITKKLFGGDVTRAENTITNLSAELTQLRNATTYVCSVRINSTVSETTEFQPLFMWFMEGVLHAVGRPPEAVQTASFYIDFHAHTLDNNKEEVPLYVSGKADVAVYHPNAEMGGVHGTAFVAELKPPYKQLYRSMAYRQKDQLIGETLGLAQMQPTRKVTKTVLTDLFAINLCIHVRNTCYLSTRAVKPRDYIMYVLFALVDSTLPQCTSLFKAVQASIEVVPPYGDKEDVGPVEPQSGVQSSGRTTRSSTKRAAAATGNNAAGSSSKRRMLCDAADPDVYDDEQKTLRRWYAESHGLIYLDQSALQHMGTCVPLVM